MDTCRGYHPTRSTLVSLSARLESRVRGIRTSYRCARVSGPSAVYITRGLGLGGAGGLVLKDFPTGSGADEKLAAREARSGMAAPGQRGNARLAYSAEEMTQASASTKFAVGFLLSRSGRPIDNAGRFTRFARGAACGTACGTHLGWMPSFARSLGTASEATAV